MLCSYLQSRKNVLMNGFNALVEKKDSTFKN